MTPIDEKKFPITAEIQKLAQQLVIDAKMEGYKEGFHAGVKATQASTPFMLPVAAQRVIEAARHVATGKGALAELRAAINAYDADGPKYAQPVLCPHNELRESPIGKQCKRCGEMVSYTREPTC